MDCGRDRALRDRLHQAARRTGAVREVALDLARHPAPRVIPDRLDLLEDLPPWARGLEHDGPVVFVQHHLVHYPARLEATVSDGVDRAQMWFLDIPYSTSRKVHLRLADRFGSDRVLDQLDDPLAPYASSQQRRLAQLLERMNDANLSGPPLVIDDGAYFAKFLAHLLQTAPLQAERYRGARIVEQTTRGHTYLASDEATSIYSSLDVSAVSVARCVTKQLFEAPFIGAAIALRLREIVSSRSPGFLPDRVLVIGYGSVGSASAAALRDALGREARIEVVERDGQKRRSARERGFHTRDVLPAPHETQFDLVVGCTGKRCFKPDDRPLLADGALLASGSSASVEFSREHFVEEADADPRDEFEFVRHLIDPDSGLHADIVFKGEGGREFTILNAGFPINFDGRLGHLPTFAIAPTHALLHAALGEVLSSQSSGLHCLSPKADDWIFEASLSHLPTARKEVAT